MMDEQLFIAALAEVGVRADRITDGVACVSDFGVDPRVCHKAWLLTVKLTDDQYPFDTWVKAHIAKNPHEAASWRLWLMAHGLAAV